MATLARALPQLENHSDTRQQHAREMGWERSAVVRAVSWGCVFVLVFRFEFVLVFGV